MTNNETNPRKRIECLITGRVQGVLYRRFAQKEAEARGISGVARNLPGGEVFISAEGTEENLKGFAEMLKIGPPLSKVEGVSIKWAPKTGDNIGFFTE